MKGNIGVHFEDVGYAVTNMKKFVSNLQKAGYEKVAATGMGTFTQYEDVKDITNALKKGNPDFKMDIIPAVTCYYKTPDSTLTLIAKDYEGYTSLCKIITQSNALGTIVEHPKNNNMNKPIVHLENLKENVAKGHLILTTSDVSGRFNRILLQDKKLADEIAALEEELNHIQLDEKTEGSYEDCIQMIEYYYHKTKAKRPLKAEFVAAEKHLEKTGDRSDLDILEQKQADYEQGQKLKKSAESMIAGVERAIRPYQHKYTKYLEKKAELEAIDPAKKEEEAKEEYKALKDIFGEENIFFELQYHGIEQEKAALKATIDFAHSIGNKNFVIGNGTRIGTTIDAPDLEDELLRLNVAAYNNDADSGYHEITNEREYCIKTEEEITASISEGLDGMISDKDTFIKDAIDRTESLMAGCFIEEREQGNHYPKYCDDENAEFVKRCMEGIRWRYPNGFPDEALYQERLKQETDVITGMGYAGYHLIVQDYLEYGRLLGYLTEEEVKDAPLTIEALDQYLTDNHIERYGVGIGPGRGSAAGSLCCYLLGITDLDPIKNGLLFERFLNPERVSMPDIDSDFRPQVRLKAREYVKHKYGETNVCEIVTKAYQHESGCIHIAASYLAAKQNAGTTSKAQKAAVKQHWVKIGNELAKAFQKFNEAVEDEEESFIAFCKNSFTAEQQAVLELVHVIKDMFTGYSQHAAGVIISKDNIGHELPLMWNATSKSLQTQCQMASAEDKGYLKMDFLGLRNLATITDVVKNPLNPEDKTDVCQDAVKRETVILQDKAVYEKVFATGSTQGIFQFESDGMKQMLKNFKPESFEDIVLLVAAYRPGPMNYIPEIIARKWYEKDPEHYEEIISKMYPREVYDKESGQYVESQYAHLYPTPKSSISSQNATLKGILKNTYGCPIYQEQIMQIFQEMAGYSLGRADEVRRAMSKKKADKLAHEKKYFIYGNEEEIKEAEEELRRLKEEINSAPAIKRASIERQIENFKIPAPIEGCIKKQNLSEEEADDLFEQMMPFAKYGFNKSHAAAYATVAMETAWLKLYRTADFYCAALNNWKDRNEVPKYAADMCQFDIHLLPPALDKKSDKFTVENGNIRFPIKQAKKLKIDMDKIHPSTSVQQFIKENPDISLVVVKTLINLGCFDRCWHFVSPERNELEKKRVNHSITTMLTWADENYNRVLKFVRLKEDLESGDIDQTQRTKKEKQFETVKQDLNNRVLADHHPDNYQIVKRKNIDILAERAKEYELTGHVFSIEDDLEHIRAMHNESTFTDLENTSDSFLPVPCVIVSIGQECTQKSDPSKVYYPVTLMDRNGNLRECRFTTDLKLAVEEELLKDGTYLPAKKPLYGIYDLPVNRFWSCRKTVKDTKEEQRSDISDIKAGLQQFIKGQDSGAAFQMEHPAVLHYQKYYNDTKLEEDRSER